MRLRDAIESDANALASFTDRPVNVMREVIHERSVRVALSGVDDDGRGDAEGEDGRGDAEGEDERGDAEGEDERGDAEGEDEGGEVVGFVAFDVRSGIVHVTDFGGDGEAIKRLFRTPREFAENEGMKVETVVADGDVGRMELIETLGFRSTGNGPRFDGRSTTRFRLDPDDQED